MLVDDVNYCTRCNHVEVKTEFSNTGIGFMQVSNTRMIAKFERNPSSRPYTRDLFKPITSNIAKNKNKLL